MTIRDEFNLPPICDEMDTGIVLHDQTTGAFLDANESLRELYGYSLEDLREMTVEDLTAPSTRFTQAKAITRIRTAAKGEPQVFDWRIERANGEYRWIRVHLNHVTRDGRGFVLGEIEDITDHRTRERRLRLLSRIIRHNLRNRTNVLYGYADQIKRALENDSLEEEIDALIDITLEVGHLSESVQEIEEIVKPDATDRSPENLDGLVRSVVEEIESEYPEADVTVEKTVDVSIVADQGVTYAIRHAIENAIEHNDQETAVVSINIDENSEQETGNLRIADNGPLIPQSEISVLDADAEASATFHGSGVGLWVMQWSLDSLGGELSFGTNEPRGNVVVMSFPKADSEVGA